MSKAKLWFFAITAALGGFLFGFDTCVISGAEEQIKSVFGLSAVLHGWVTSSALWGTVLGAFVGGWVTDRFGRKPTLCAIGAIYFVSALWSALATGPWMLMMARFLGGIGVGVSTIAAPVYIAEISPAESRGKLTALFQFNIVFGVLVALTSNLLLKDLGANAWRWMLGAQCAPAAVFAVLAPFLVESPRWLAMKAEGHETGDARPESAAGFWSRANMKPILLAFFVAFFNQLSGCNAVNYFAVRIFGLAGLDHNAKYLATFGLGILNLLSTFTGLWLIDKFGRKTLLLIGGTGYVISLFAASFFFLDIQSYGPLAAATIFLFMAAHAVGQGTVIWVLISESFPQKFRAQGQALGASTHWVFAALVTLFFPIAAESVPAAGIFAFFGVMMVFHLLWAIFFVPETRGRKLEDIA